MEIKIMLFIRNSIQLYYKKTSEWYSSIFKNINITNKNINEYNKKYYKNNKNNTTLLGVYNKNTSIFSWAYILPKKFNNDNSIIKELFDWAYKKNANSELEIYIRKIFLNSNINIKTKEQIDTIVFLSFYMLRNAITTIISIENNNTIKCYIVKK